MGRSKTQKICSAKQAERERRICAMEAELGLAVDYPKDEEYITTSAEQIVARLKGREPGWTAERVMTAFIRAACAAHRSTNCLTEVMFEEALHRAKAMDRAFDATGIAEGAFWGLPSSFKDSFNVLGVDTTIGCTPRCFMPIQELDKEAGLVQLFRKAGGIPFCKTNVPQAMLAFECSNPVFGRTTNPYDSARGPGGSSGGEAALVALAGTPFGWGTDAGGSLRIPAAYSGCCGLKPVRGRWPIMGNRLTVYGFEGVKPVAGPMARSVNDLAFQAKTMITMALEDECQSFKGEQLLPIPWQELSLPKKLKIGYYTDDGVVKTSPACARAVNEVVAALRAEGHEVVLFEPPNVIEAFESFVALTSAEGYKGLLSNLGQDPMDSSMKLVTLGPSLPRPVQKLIGWGIAKFMSDPLFASVFDASRKKSVSEYWTFTAKRDMVANAFRKAAWEDAGLDAIICPVQAVPALEHRRTEYLSPLALQTMLYNVIDSTVGVLPVTRVDLSRDVVPDNFLAGSPGSRILERRVYSSTDPAYDAAKMHGLPVGVQVVGQAWQEEKVLKVMELVERLVDFA